MILRGTSGPLPWPLWGLVVTIGVALLMGAHQRDAFGLYALPLNYAYWVLRLLMAYLLFAGALALLELSPLAQRLAWPWLVVPAALLSLPLFTLCVTMLDLLLGEPEFGPDGFGIGSSGDILSAGAMVALFGRESLYHLDNHLALCALIVLPRFVQTRTARRLAASPAEPAMATIDPAPAAARLPAAAPAFLRRFDPPVTGPLLAVQAQEHYLRVITPGGAHCTLYRFGDALRELQGQSGLQVHRSFWVADDGVAAVRGDRRGLRIVLRNGEQVPVSARHVDTVQRRYGERLETVA